MSNGDLTHMPASTDEPTGAPRRWLALAILLAAGFMDLLDTTIVNVAIPAIRGSLHSNYAGIQWIVAGYLLAVAVGLITGGRLGDIAGRRRVFVIGVIAFGLTSLGSGLAVSPAMLIATRVLQGMSAAIMIPQILSIIQVNFPRGDPDLRTVRRLRAAQGAPRRIAARAAVAVPRARVLVRARGRDRLLLRPRRLLPGVHDLSPARARLHPARLGADDVPELDRSR